MQFGLQSPLAQQQGAARDNYNIGSVSSFTINNVVNGMDSEQVNQQFQSHNRQHQQEREADRSEIGSKTC
jgi:hypothetical protein